MHVVRTEAQAAFAEIAFGHWAGADDHRISFFADIDDPNALLALGAVVLYGLIDRDNEFSSGQWQRRMRIATERRTPVDMAYRFRLADVGDIENHHTRIDERDVRALAMRNCAVHMKMLSVERRPISRSFFTLLGPRNPPAPCLLWICRIGNVGNQICALFDSREHGSYVGVLAVGKPHTMHAFARKS